MNHPIQITSVDFNQWQVIVEIMAKLISVPSAIITKVDPPDIEVLFASTNPDNPYAQGLRVTMNNHFCEGVVRSQSKLLIPNALRSDEWKSAPELEDGMISYLGYPIFWPAGELFGTICVLDQKENYFTQEYEQLIEQFRNLIETQLSLLAQKRTIEEKNEELEKKQAEIQVLRGILPICSTCKKIRRDDGYWEQIEVFMKEHSDLLFSHGICPDCELKFYNTDGI